MEDRPQDDIIGEAIREPEPAHVHDEDTESDSELEATELRPVTFFENDPKRRPRLSRVLTPEKPLIHWYDPMKKFWRHHIRISVPHVDCRDHLGMYLTSRLFQAGLSPRSRSSQLAKVTGQG